LDEVAESITVPFMVESAVEADLASHDTSGSQFALHLVGRIGGCGDGRLVLVVRHRYVTLMTGRKAKVSATLLKVQKRERLTSGNRPKTCSRASHAFPEPQDVANDLAGPDMSRVPWASTMPPASMASRTAVWPCLWTASRSPPARAATKAPKRPVQKPNTAGTGGFICCCWCGGCGESRKAMYSVR
jgi:hypothetical protein